MKIIKFGASWCQPCKMLGKTLDTMELPYELEEIDLDQKPQKAGDYGIRGVPTMVLVDDKGKEVRRVVGLQSAVKIGEWLA